MNRPWLKIHAQMGAEPPALIERPLGAFIEDHAANIPDAPALYFQGQHIHYGALNRYANQLANGFLSLGIGRGDVVGLHMPNVPQYVIAVIALSKIGAIGSGVSPLLAPPEISHQLQDLGAKALISLARFTPALEAIKTLGGALEHILITGAGDMIGGPDIEPSHISGVKTLALRALMEGQSETAQQCAMSGDEIFMIQYTGGTTGPSKGAQLSVRNIINNPRMVNALGEPLEIGTQIFAAAFPMFHIAGFTSVINGLMHGALYFMLPNPRDTDAFIDAMLAHKVTHLAAVPALYEMLMANPRFKDVDFSALKGARTGAAPITQRTSDELASFIGRNKLSDVLGMTETSPCYILNPFSHNRKGAVGLPIPNVDVRIRDVETGLKDMPIGKPGEICTAGPHVMQGYLNLPEETARALRDIDGQIYMHTGDIGYMDEDGYIFLCDRAKDMLIVGGFKVFSVEVEDKLKSLPLIGGSALIGQPDNARLGNDIVNLFVVLSAPYKDIDENEAKAEIIAFMRENMAPYKIPKHIHFIDALPLTPIGKIDKKALRAQLSH